MVYESLHFIHSPRYFWFRNNTERYRKYRECPIPGCKARPQKKLSNHLTKFHSELTGKERKRLLRRARIVIKTNLKAQPGQSKLCFKGGILTKTKRPSKGKAVTKHLGHFPSSHPKLADFKEHLMGIAGKRRSESVAETIVRDVSKILYFYDNESLKWEGITNCNNLQKYINHLDSLKMGPEGQLTKLERVCDLLWYLKKHDKDNINMKNEIVDTESEIKLWKRTLREKKKALQVRRLEEISEQDLTLDDITAVVDNDRMWLKFSEIVDKAKKGSDIPDEDLKVAMGIVMINVKLKSFSRPSAIANCTVDEYQRATRCDGSTVIKVYNHKTGHRGTAKITIDDQLTERLRLYFKYIRPLLVDPGHDINLLFILPGSQKIYKFSNLENFLQKRFTISIPNSTTARKIGATCAARSLDYQTNTLVTKQMSHNPEVSRVFYEAVRGPADAAFAFQQMESLRKGEVTSHMRSYPSQPEDTSNFSSRWTQSDTTFVKKKFRENIESGQTPGLSQCEDLGLNKTPKQVQDKVRTLIRQAHRANED